MEGAGAATAFTCDRLDAETVSGIVGAEVGAGSAEGTAHRGDVEFEHAGCSYHLEDGISSYTVWLVTPPDAFERIRANAEAGREGAYAPVPGVGDAAFTVPGFGTGNAVVFVRVGDTVLEVDSDFTQPPATVVQTLTELAAAAVAAL